MEEHTQSQKRAAGVHHHFFMFFFKDLQLHVSEPQGEWMTDSSGEIHRTADVCV